MSSIRKGLLQFIFSGAYMKRWNDKLRPIDLCELDKQGHKMMVAWALYVLNSRGMSPEERRKLGLDIIEGGLMEYFYRLVITDIKPPVFYRIKENPAHYRQLTEWVLRQLAPRLQPVGPEFWGRLEERLLAPRPDSLATQILDASHQYASSWEFGLIKNLGVWDDEKQQIDEKFQDDLEQYRELLGIPDLLEGAESTLGHFAYLCGQLRFQTRWSQTPRIPETSVLGHLFTVAAYSYFCSIVVDASEAQRVNNFFSALFHDLPEVLTRDIISPVKQSVEPLGGLIREYEDSELERRVLCRLRDGGYPDIAERLSYFLGSEVGSEFVPTARRDDIVRQVSREELNEKYTEDENDPKDGALIKVCDNLAAFVEAYTAVNNGISSSQLQQALWRIKQVYENTALSENLHIGALLADFD